MDDHDQRFKALLREFLPEFVALFFPDWAGRFDWTGTEWLEQEAFLDPPRGEKRQLDVVAKVPTRGPVPDPAGGTTTHQVVVVHVEVESPDRAAGVRPRMWQYYDYLRRRHDLPVWPVCLFLRVGLGGVGWDGYEERLWDHPVLRFEYAYVGLPALDAAGYLTGPNPLGVALAALMALPAADRARVKAEGLARIAAARENDARKYLLAECFDNYLPLSPAEAAEFDRIQAEQSAEGRATMGQVFTKVRLEGAMEYLQLQLEEKFGPLGEDVVGRLRTLTAEQAKQLARAVLHARSLAELGLTGA